VWPAHLQADAVTIAKRHMIDDCFHTLAEIAIPINESRTAIAIDDLQVTKGKFIAIKPQRVARSTCLIGLIAVQGHISEAEIKERPNWARPEGSTKIDRTCLTTEKIGVRAILELIDRQACACADMGYPGIIRDILITEDIGPWWAIDHSSSGGSCRRTSRRHRG